MSRALIQIENLKKIYRPDHSDAVAVNALDGLNLDIQKGEFVSIMGPSGSGKSTLMQILGLLDRPSEGRYLLNGIDVNTLNDDELARLRCEKIGFIFQFFNLLPRTTAVDNVALPMLYHGTENASERAKELLNQMGLNERLHHKPHQLSGGQQQRVAIARALANQPEIIFADEPTGNISTTQSQEILDLLDQLNQRGVTIILVTHEPEVAERAKRQIIIKDGKVLSDIARPSDTVHNPSSKRKTGGESPSSSQIKKLKEAFRMAVIALSLNKLRTMLATLGIVIGISSVVAMVAIGEGAQRAIKEQLSSLGTNLLAIRAVNPKVSKSMGSSFRKFTVEDYQALKKMSLIDSQFKNVDGQVYGHIQVSKGHRNSRTRLIGSYPSFKSMGANHPTLGRFFNQTENQRRERVAVLGQTVVNNLYSDGINPIGSLIKINKVDFRVIGVLPAKGATPWRDNDDQVVVPVLTAMNRILGKKRLNGLSVELASQYNSEASIGKISDFFRKRRKLRPSQPNDFEIRNMSEIQKIYTRTTSIISSMLATIALISLLVGGIGIMNVMLVAVKERTREVGLRKALGAKKSDILNQFLIESISIGLLGGLIGIFGGYVVTVISSTFFSWPAVMPLATVFVAFVFALIVGIVFGIWPAKQASELSPIEALRFE